MLFVIMLEAVTAAANQTTITSRRSCAVLSRPGCLTVQYASKRSIFRRCLSWSHHRPGISSELSFGGTSASFENQFRTLSRGP